MLSFFRSLNSILWGVPLLVGLLGTHLFFTIRLNFVQKKTFYAIKLSIAPEEGTKNGFSGGLQAFSVWQLLMENVISLCVIAEKHLQILTMAVLCMF